MRLVTVLGIGLAGFAAVAVAQPGPDAGQPLQAGEPPQPPRLPCPPNGYAKPLFGGASDNDGVIRGYEVASPCIKMEVILAADALGMARGNPVGVKNLSTVRFGATGMLADDNGRPQRHGDIAVAIHYGIPAIRVTTAANTAENAVRTSRVVADGIAWNEAAPGVNPRRAPAKAALAREPLRLLSPFGALYAIIEAEGHATVGKESGRTVFTGISPYDKAPTKVVLDEKSRPISAELRYRGKLYHATYQDYTDKWEPPYLFVFPAKITITADGKPYADLAVTRFNNNPYVNFALPAFARR